MLVIMLVLILYIEFYLILDTTFINQIHVINTATKNAVIDFINDHPLRYSNILETQCFKNTETLLSARPVVQNIKVQEPK